MMHDETGYFTKVYEAPPHMNAVLVQMLRKMTDAKFGQVVNFGKAEKRGIRTADKQLEVLLNDGTIKHLSDDLYAVSPYYFGNGEWSDIVPLRKAYNEEEFNKRYVLKITRCEYTRRDGLIDEQEPYSKDNFTSTVVK